MAGTLIAGLELAKTGRLELRQDETFGQIMLRPHEQVEATDPQPEPEEDPTPAEDVTPRHTREKKQDA